MQYELAPTDGFREPLPLAVYLRAGFSRGGVLRQHASPKPGPQRGTPLEHVSWLELEALFRAAADRADGSWVEVSSEGGGYRIAGPTEGPEPRVQIPDQIADRVAHLARCSELETRPTATYRVLRDAVLDLGAALPPLGADTHQIDWWAVDRALRVLCRTEDGRALVSRTLGELPAPLERRFLDRFGRNCRARAVWLTGPHGRYAAYQVLAGEAGGYYDEEPTFLTRSRDFVGLSDLEGPPEVEDAEEESSDHLRIR